MNGDKGNSYVWQEQTLAALAESHTHELLNRIPSHSPEMPLGLVLVVIEFKEVHVFILDSGSIVGCRTDVHFSRKSMRGF